MSKLYGKISEGMWTLSSEKDSRFNCSSAGKVGWLHMPYNAIMKVKEFEKKYDITAPNDLVLTYVKV